MEEREERNSPKKTGDNELRALLVDFASTTTAHGVGRFATAPVATAKVTWFFIWLCVMAGFSYMLAQLIILYKSKPVSTSVSVEYQKVRNTRCCYYEVFTLGKNSHRIAWKWNAG